MNYEIARITSNIDCCGVKEAAQIQKAKTPKEAMRQLMDYGDDGFGWFGPEVVYVYPAKVIKQAKEDGRRLGHRDLVMKCRDWCLRPKSAHLFFTDSHSPIIKDNKWLPWKAYGQPFADFIVEEKLGTVVHIPPAENPNTGNEVEMWVWTPDMEALEKWCFANIKQESKTYKPVDDGDRVY